MAAARTGRGARRGWRLALLLLAQPLWALLLVLAVHPPARLQPEATLTVLTAGGEPARVESEAKAVALPEADATAGVLRVPDLATALRLHPDTRVLRVLGDGLIARDRDLPAGLAVEFEPPLQATGLTELSLPASTVAGDTLRIHGRANGLAGGSAELLDPAGVRVDSAALDDGGGFRLQAPTFAAGPALFGLRLRDGRGAQVSDEALHLWLEAASTPALRLLAGAPNAETRFLRRWATDAGLPVQARIALGGGMALGDGGGVDAAALRRTDVLVIDARAWSGLGAGGRTAVLAAVEAGMGLVVRADAPGIPAGLATGGFRLAGGQGTVPVQLAATGSGDAGALRARLGAGTADAPFDLEQAQAPIPPLLRRQLAVEGADAVALGTGAGGGPWAWWRPHGLGRVLVWTLQDSYRLVLSGRADLHAQLWREAVATAARAQAAAPVRIGWPAFADERVTICGAGTDARVVAPDGSGSPLWGHPDGNGACAGYWPRQPGWHRVVVEGDDAPRAAFHVHSEAALPTVRAAHRAETTLALVAPCDRDCPATNNVGPTQTSPGPSWPWWLAWLAVSAALWWFERSRPGRPREDHGITGQAGPAGRRAGVPTAGR
ncbi:carboxypeptidase regulatory-like domain-containing protein [Luteimonas yindakuii]|uniref:carboxypeptidase regulatory-like domain-containing protein n=1 Tax=Luteimonas yindakuii TaxID=2565782 RepID=UPI0011077F77|nr:carboxypeptidase regulatory-like domain-containing protein [Luteimonas yindakuii]QCO67302.2 carboxypeptidase regulatory-like domain-containing protein [Luteimonas yindakuii]